MEEPFVHGGSSSSRRIVVRNIPAAGSDLPIGTLLRKEKLKSIADSINSLVSYRKPDNLFIYGKTGTGKTTCLRYLLSSLNGVGGVVPVYLNCHQHQTTMAVFNRIAGMMDNSFSRRGFASYEVFGRIRELLHKENKSVLLVLDDIEGLMKNASDVFFPIIEENKTRRNSFGIIAISNDFSVFEKLDTKVKSSLMFRVLEFEPYAKEEIKQILGSFAEAALAEGSCSDEILDKTAGLGESAEGNARFAIWLLFESARHAEKRGSDKIEPADVEAAYERHLPLTPLGNDPEHADLPREELLILDILKLGEKSSSEIYSTLLKHTDKSKRQVRNYLTALIAKGYVESETLQNGNSFLKPRVFRLKKR